MTRWTRAERAAAEAAWRSFAVRHQFEFGVHGHGALFCATGAVGSLRVSASEDLEGLNLSAVNALPQAEGWVLCDAAFSVWCREPARMRLAEEVEGSVAKLRLPRQGPVISAVGLPHRVRAVPADSAHSAFNERYRVLAASPPPTWTLEIVDGLMNLPSPVRIFAHRGLVSARFPATELADGVLHAFCAVTRALRRSEPYR